MHRLFWLDNFYCPCKKASLPNSLILYPLKTFCEELKNAGCFELLLSVMSDRLLQLQFNLSFSHQHDHDLKRAEKLEISEQKLSFFDAHLCSNFVYSCFLRNLGSSVERPVTHNSLRSFPFTFGIPIFLCKLVEILVQNLFEILSRFITEVFLRKVTQKETKGCQCLL